MEVARRARVPVRASITKTVNELQSEMCKSAVQRDQSFIQKKYQKLLELYNKVCTFDEQILGAMLELVDFNEEEYNKESNSIEEYEDKIRDIKIDVEVFLNPVRCDSPGLGDGSSIRRKNYRLPKIELKKFDGQWTEWLGWWAQFSKIHEDDELHETDKFQYLVQSMVPDSRAHKLVVSYPQTEENYCKVVEALKDRFGDKTLLAEVYIRKLQNIVFNLSKTKSYFELSQMYDEIETQLRSLDSLQVTLDKSAFLLPLIESGLPVDLIKVWQRCPESGYDEEHPQSSEKRLDALMKFLKREVKGEERIKMIKGNVSSDDGGKEPFGIRRTRSSKHGWNTKDVKTNIPTAQSLYAEITTCIFCGKSNHNSQDCCKATTMTLEDRNKKVTEAKACFRCLKKSHSFKKCRAAVKCVICYKNHHAIMCNERSKLCNTNEDPKKIEDVQVSGEPSVSNASHVRQEGMVLMKTIQVLINGKNGDTLKARLLFDEGSNRSYIKTSVAEKLKCPIVEEFKLQTTVFGGNTTPMKKKVRYDVELQSLNKRYSKILCLINEDRICGNCPKIPYGPWMSELKAQNIHVNDTDVSEDPEIQILIGSNMWSHLMTGRTFKLICGLIAVESVFGWTLSGEILPFKDSLAARSISLFVNGEKTLQDLWSIETIGIRDPVEKLSQSEYDSKVKEDFQQNITKENDGRYVVKLPWIDREIPIPSNRIVATKRLETATTKLVKQKEFNNYDSIFESWEKEKFIEIYPQESVRGHFLPHRPVFKPESETTPVRPVFDASCQVGNSPSLNQCLEKGPNLLELIPSILLRFREKKIGVISDIRKAFQMISVAEEDRNYQKFLWWENYEQKKMKVFRHCRVVFGMNCSPFILAAVLDHHLKTVSHEKREVAKILHDSFYVDNSVVSVDTEEEYQFFRSEAVQILAEARMELRQWETSIDDPNKKPITTVLGMIWDKSNDTLHCQTPKKIKEDFKVTKRSVLSIAAQIFDPIGFTCPAVLQVKLMLQTAWATKISWDEEWGKTKKEIFNKWLNDVNELGKIGIPRNAFGCNDRKDIQLHMFADASGEAYGTVIFLRSQTKVNVEVQLLLAKSRLAPLASNKEKKVTIPRLELLGCLIGARLLKQIVISLHYQDVPIFCWTDSSTALAWIKRENNWGTFVGNRVKEINSIVNKVNWRHVPGTLNPADLPSRGCTPQELLDSKWWEGPYWLKREENLWPRLHETPDEKLISLEKRKSQIVVNVNTEKPQLRFSDYWKNVKVAAWIRRFIGNLKRRPSKRIRYQYLTSEEMREGENDILRSIQQNNFISQSQLKNMNVEKLEDKLLHLKTRLTYKQDDHLFKNPVLLPSNDPLVKQLIEFVHRFYCHAGTQFVLGKLRERYWIIQGRRTVSNVIKKCTVCRRFSSKSLTCDPAPLPIERIETVYAFQTTGVDLAGPLHLKGGKKVWIVIYTCAVYRGVYLDIINSLSSEEFLDSFHTFTYKVGRPSTMFSDNGTNFIGAQSMMKRLNWKELEPKLQVKQIVWRFNPPTAAWWGGWWERLIRSLKDLLKRMIGSAKLTKLELEKCLIEVAYVMNERPLTTLTEDENDLIPLTPAMFMRDLPVAGLPESDKITRKDLQAAYRKIINLKESLKARFRKEYLSNLIQKKSEVSTKDVEVGDVVLVGADNKKRFEWPLGRIMELIPGTDKKIRVAKVKTKNGILIRPLQRLFPLEVSNPSKLLSKSTEVVEKVNKKNKSTEIEPLLSDQSLVEAIVTRSGRIVKKPKYYNTWNQ